MSGWSKGNLKIVHIAPTKRPKTPEKIFFERRSEVRVSVDRAVRIATLGNDRREMQGKAVDLSGSGMLNRGT